MVPSVPLAHKIWDLYFSKCISSSQNIKASTKKGSGHRTLQCALGWFSHRVAMSICVSVCPWQFKTLSSGDCGDFWSMGVLLILGCGDIIFFLHFSTFLDFWSQPIVLLKVGRKTTQPLHSWKKHSPTIGLLDSQLTNHRTVGHSINQPLDCWTTLSKYWTVWQNIVRQLSNHWHVGLSTVSAFA